MTIGDRIRVQRMKLHMTQEEVASRMNVTRATYSRYEAGGIKHIPTAAISRLAVILDCTSAYLMGWDEADAENRAPSEEEAAALSKRRADDSIDRIVKMAERMSQDQRAELLKFAKYMWPEVFDDTVQAERAK